MDTSVYDVRARTQSRFVLLVGEPLLPGGVATYTRSILAILREAGWPHALLTSAPPAAGLFDAREFESVHVVKGLFWIGWRPFVFRRMTRWLHGYEPALIHGLSARTNAVCARLSQALQVPYLVSVHHFQQRGGLHVEACTGRVNTCCAGVIALSESLRENLVNEAGTPKELTRVIPAGVRVPPCATGGSPTSGFAGRPALVDKPPVPHRVVPLVASVGKLVKRKDFATYLRAARRILDQLGADCSFVICGDGPDEAALRRLARELKIDKHVTFCHGNTALGPLLRDTDVYVQCSRVEGFGTRVLEAMAQSTPVVATSTGGLLALVREDETGFLVPIGDVDAIAERVLRLLKDAALRRRMGEAARQTALAEFSYDEMKRRTLELYEEAARIELAAV